MTNLPNPEGDDKMKNKIDLPISLTATIDEENDRAMLVAKAYTALREIADPNNWGRVDEIYTAYGTIGLRQTTDPRLKQWNGRHHPRDLAQYALDLVARIAAVKPPSLVAYVVNECQECGHHIMSDEQVLCPHNTTTGVSVRL